MVVRITDRVRQELLRSNPWLVGNLIQQEGELTIGGWALPPGGSFELATFLVNGREPDAVKCGLPTPALANVYHFVPNVDYAGFQIRATLSQDELAGSTARISFVNAYSKEPLNHWQDIYIPLDVSSYAVPDAAQLMRTSGTPDFWKYRLYGTTVAKQLAKILKMYSFGRIDITGLRVLDWGCGCGRLSQAILREWSPRALTGVDIDVANVNWCAKNIADGKFMACDLTPPLGMEDEAFDVIIGISVVTHQSRSIQMDWLSEIRRLLRPGGVAILSFNGEFVFSKVQEAVIQRTLMDGIDDSQHDANLDGYIGDKEYYRLTHETRQYVRNNFDKYLDVIDIIAGGCGSVQDFVLLGKR